MFEEEDNLNSLFDTLNTISAQNITERRMGTTGGGSDAIQQDPMETNRFVSMNLNPHLTQNVSSFMGGGRMHNPYKYRSGGQYKYNTGGMYANAANQMIAAGQLGDISGDEKFGLEKYTTQQDTLHPVTRQTFTPPFVNMLENMISQDSDDSQLNYDAMMRLIQRHHNKQNLVNPEGKLIGMKYGGKMKKRYTQGGRF